MALKLWITTKNSPLVHFNNTDGLTDGRTDKGKFICPPLLKWGHKNTQLGSVNYKYVENELLFTILWMYDVFL